MSEEQTTFKVTDRRLFNPDGTMREGAKPVDEKPPAPAAEQTPATEQPVAEEDLPDVNDPASFVNFIMSLASNAASALGMMEHPVTGQVGVDLQLAKYWIDILGMLRQKTSGNLSGQEIQVFEGLLSDLRMQYVALTQPRPKTPSFSAKDLMGRR
jgi:PBP1b-binding outer membrane lipoprotein LpoB